jgi:hypothetical protein
MLEKLTVRRKEKEMTIQDFVLRAEAAAAALFEESGDGQIDIDSVEVVKANDSRLHGLRLARGGENAGWNVYIDDLYERHLEGDDLDSLLEEAARRCKEGLGFRAPVTPADLKLDFDSIRDRLSVRLLGTAHNMSYMDGKPYIDTGCGLALVATIGCDSGEASEWFLTVTDDLLKSEIKAGREELLTAALGNAVKTEPPVLVSLEEYVHANYNDSVTVQNYMENPDIDDYLRRRALMLSNESALFGAAVLFYPGVTEKIADILGCGYYVLPSSIHEVMIISEAAEPDLRGMTETVAEANRFVVDWRDFLSDHVYYYDAGQKKLSVVTGPFKCDNDCRRFTA